MFCKLDVRRKLIVTLALSYDNRKIVVRYFVNRAPDSGRHEKNNQSQRWVASTRGQISLLRGNSSVPRLVKVQFPRSNWQRMKASRCVSTEQAQDSLCSSLFTRTCVLPASRLNKLSYRRGTALCVVLVEILPIAKQQWRNYLYDKSWTNRSYEVGGLQWADV